MNKGRRLHSDFITLIFLLSEAEDSLQAALKELDLQLKESADTLFGHDRKPNYKKHCAANAKALDEAHNEIEKCTKDLFQFKLKHGESR